MKPRPSSRGISAKRNCTGESPECCASQQGCEEFVVYSDCQTAVNRANDSRVIWRSRSEVYLPNAFFDRILRRASYLRRTQDKVKTRMPVEPHQQEIFDLWQANERTFCLSESALWLRLQEP